MAWQVLVQTFLGVTFTAYSCICAPSFPLILLKHMEVFLKLCAIFLAPLPLRCRLPLKSCRWACGDVEQPLRSLEKTPVPQLAVLKWMILEVLSQIFILCLLFFLFGNPTIILIMWAKCTLLLSVMNQLSTEAATSWNNLAWKRSLKSWSPTIN